MVKYTQFPLDITANFWNGVCAHWGGTARADPKAWHSIYPYEGWYPPYPPRPAPGCNGQWPHDVPDRDALSLKLCFDGCKMLQALPHLVRDCCPWCWDDDFFKLFTPGFYRWKVTEGHSRAHTPPVILWDWANLPPPYDFQYTA